MHRDPALRNAVVQIFKSGKFLCQLIDFDHSISFKPDTENFNEEMLQYYENVMRGKERKGIYLDKRYEKNPILDIWWMMEDHQSLVNELH